MDEYGYKKCYIVMYLFKVFYYPKLFSIKIYNNFIQGI